MMPGFATPTPEGATTRRDRRLHEASPYHCLTTSEVDSIEQRAKHRGEVSRIEVRRLVATIRSLDAEKRQLEAAVA